MTEEWRPINGYEGFYEVSDKGRVRSVARLTRIGQPVQARIRKLSEAVGGYKRVGLRKNGKGAHHLVHALVLEAFVGPRPAGMEGCHNDGDPSNNQLENLRWDTPSANRRDTVRAGKHIHARKTHCSAGHEYDTILYRRNSIDRRCSVCVNKRRRDAYAAKRAASALREKAVA